MLTNWSWPGRPKIAVKLKNIEIGGLRGVRNQLTIPLPSSSSVILYGENGGGKSSITDGLEWFFRDRVEHLSSQEIGRNGIPALRNMGLSLDEDAYVALEMTDPALSAVKSLSFNNSRYSTGCSNSSAEFNSYRDDTAAENFILRYRDLLDFIMSTKAEKLEALSQIIGFGEVTKTKKILRKAANNLGRLEKTREYDKYVGQEQAEIIEHLGQNITNDTQFVEAAQDLLDSLNLGKKVTDRQSLKLAIAQIKSPVDDSAISLEISYRNVLTALNAVQESGDACRSQYRAYYANFKKMRENSEKLNALGIERLITEGVSVLEGPWDRNSCPLCRQSMDKNDLLLQLKHRQEHLADLRREHNQLEDEKADIIAILHELTLKIVPTVEERCLTVDGNENIKTVVEAVSMSLTKTKKMVSESSVFDDVEIAAPAEFLTFGSVDLSSETSVIEEKKNEAGENRRDDHRFTVAEKLTLAEKGISKGCNAPSRTSRTTTTDKLHEFDMSGVHKAGKGSVDTLPYGYIRRHQRPLSVYECRR